MTTACIQVQKNTMHIHTTSKRL